MCSPNDSLKYMISLLKDKAYLWWCTLTTMVEFKRKYVSRLYLGTKKKEFLELNQGNGSVAEYEWEFMRLSKYAQNIISSEEEICIHFEDG
ncbi:Hexaprenyldihydroxybenzoate methyltransferase, mitochondrial-like protein [Gossypium australe]|uniref:Hexaprenyldihydroxybenzoate methyltransferase, mitochondrial-like protein n=1 Tax=Gossypium australe TaxID=47621 RepID=A0A5B6VMM7_9ROSI|nr:Hexaprenyldihydroxybenzoate methyltransferase, mitochondrial-like protein [Gossypium australe]